MKQSDKYAFFLFQVPKFEDHAYAKAECRLVSTSTSVQTEDHDEYIFKARPIKETYVQTDLPVNAKCDKSVQIDSFDGDMCQNLTEIKQKNQMKIIKTLKEKVTDLSKECSELKKRVFSSSNMLQSNDQVQFYTGLPNLETYNALFHYLQPKALHLTYWRGKSTTKTRSRLGVTKLSLEEQFFITLVRLRLNLSVEDLADRFGVSVGTISSVFNTWCRFLSLELEDLFPYPTAEQVPRNVPSSFSKYPNTRLIIDCTEIFVQKPSALKAQRQTWSNYKHRNTHKILVGITPDGTVVFISSLFGGSASDKFIVKHSGLLQLIEVGDHIMADRGFDIQAQLSKLGAHLNMPTFRSGSYQLTPEQVEETRRIAEVRMYSCGASNTANKDIFHIGWNNASYSEDGCGGHI